MIKETEDEKNNILLDQIKICSQKKKGRDLFEDAEITAKKFKTKQKFFKKFIIDSNRIVEAREVANIIQPILGLENFEIRRVRKESTSYMRLRIRNTADESAMRKAIVTVQESLDVIVKPSKNNSIKSYKEKENKFIEETSK